MTAFAAPARLRGPLSLPGVALYVLLAGCAVAYLAVRALTTLNPRCRAWSCAVLAAEASAALSTLLYALALLRAPLRDPEPPCDEAGQCEAPRALHVLVPCYDEALPLVAATVLAAARAPLPPCVTRTVYLCDDGGDAAKRAWALAVAPRLLPAASLVYVARSRGADEPPNGKSANLNHCLRTAVYPGDAAPPESDLVAFFDADMVCDAAFFTRLLPLLRPRDALVMCPQRFHNLDPACDVFAHANVAWWDVTVPAIAAAYGGCTCCGTNFVARAQALWRAGWFPTWTLCEDTQLGCSLQALGYCLRYVNEPLACGEAPASIAGVFRQRARWAVGSLQNAAAPRRCNALWQAGHPLALRLLTLGAAAHYALSAFYVPIFMLVPPLCLLLDWTPLLLNRPAAALFAAYYTLMTAANHWGWRDADAACAGWFGTNATPVFGLMHARAALGLAARRIAGARARFRVTPKSAGDVLAVSGAPALHELAALDVPAQQQPLPPLPLLARARAAVRAADELPLLAACGCGCAATAAYGAWLLSQPGGAGWHVLVSTLWAAHNVVPFAFALAYGACGYGTPLRAVAAAGKWLVVLCSTFAVTWMVRVAFAPPGAAAATAQAPWFALACGLYATAYTRATWHAGPSSRYRAPPPRPAGVRRSAALAAALLLAPASAAAVVPFFPDSALLANASGLYLPGHGRVTLRGVSWFGFETVALAPHGLWAASMDSLLDFCATAGFNALRLPFSAELALALDARSPPPQYINASVNPRLVGLTAGAVLDAVVAGAKARGMLVLPDMHALSAGGPITPLWYDATYSEAAVQRAWLALAGRYAAEPFVFGADLKNEPHGAAAWGGTNTSRDWAAAAERLGDALHGVNPRLLVFVGGIEATTRFPAFNGGNLEWAAARPIRLRVPDKVVYSPHVYGPAVYQQTYFSDAAFPANMPAIWRQQWASLASAGVGAVVPGEWGGPVGDAADEALQGALASFLAASGLDSSFFWCLNPNSVDTGGLLGDDWVTPVASKLALVAAATPGASAFVATPFPPPAPPPPSPPPPPPPSPPRPPASAAAERRAPLAAAALLAALVLLCRAG
jgi:endoglucanase